MSIQIDLGFDLGNCQNDPDYVIDKMEDDSKEIN